MKKNETLKKTQLKSATKKKPNFTEEKKIEKIALFKKKIFKIYLKKRNTKIIPTQFLV